MRQYLAQTEFDSSGLLSVTGKDFRYMRQVLRLVVGDIVQVRTKSGLLVTATVDQILEGKKALILCKRAKDDFRRGGDSAFDARDGGSAQGEIVPPDSGQTFSHELWLFQCVARPQKMDVIIRQATECGVAKIIPVVNAFCQSGAQERNFRNERYQRIIKEARQQSGSPVATEVTESLSVQEALALWKEHVEASSGSDAGERGADQDQKKALALVLYERTARSKAIHQILGETANIGDCALFCGSEGGISPQEIEELSAGGFEIVHFNTNILRCETAALYGIASLQSALTEKQIWQCRES